MTGMRNKKRVNPFVQIDKNILTNSDISWKAKGILSYLLSKPDGWITYITDIEKRSSDGRDSVRAGIRELETIGYIERKRIREKGKFKGWEYHVYEYPKKKNTEDVISDIGLTEDGKSDIGETNVGESNTSNNDLSNNNLSNKELSNKDIVADAPSLPFEEIISYLNERAKTSYRASGKKTQGLIKARLNEGFTVDDFQKVIDIKTFQWLTDSKMSGYLRPETLFGTKFESYLNEKGGTSSEVDSGRNQQPAKTYADGLDF